MKELNEVDKSFVEGIIQDHDKGVDYKLGKDELDEIRKAGIPVEDILGFQNEQISGKSTYSSTENNMQIKERDEIERELEDKSIGDIIKMIK